MWRSIFVCNAYIEQDMIFGIKAKQSTCRVQFHSLNLKYSNEVNVSDGFSVIPFYSYHFGFFFLCLARNIFSYFISFSLSSFPALSSDCVCVFRILLVRFSFFLHFSPSKHPYTLASWWWWCMLCIQFVSFHFSFHANCTHTFLGHW